MSLVKLETSGFFVRRKGMSKPPVKLGVDKSYLIEKESNLEMIEFIQKLLEERKEEIKVKQK